MFKSPISDNIQNRDFGPGIKYLFKISLIYKEILKFMFYGLISHNNGYALDIFFNFLESILENQYIYNIYI